MRHDSRKHDGGWIGLAARGGGLYQVGSNFELIDLYMATKLTERVVTNERSQIMNM